MRTLDDLDVVPARREAYRASELAAVLGVSEATARRWLADGTVASVKIGRARLIPRDEIARLLNTTR